MCSSAFLLDLTVITGNEHESCDLVQLPVCDLQAAAAAAETEPGRFLKAAY
jgi:hypothetical protein